MFIYNIIQQTTPKDYEGSHTKPFSYFIECEVGEGAEVLTGMQGISLPAGTYQKITDKA